MFRCLFLLFEQFGAQQKSFLPIWRNKVATETHTQQSTCPPTRKGLWDMWKWRIQIVGWHILITRLHVIKISTQPMVLQTLADVYTNQLCFVVIISKKITKNFKFTFRSRRSCRIPIFSASERHGWNQDSHSLHSKISHRHHRFLGGRWSSTPPDCKN